MSTASQHVRDANEKDFQREVVDASRDLPVVVDFWAPWCGPCRMLGPTLERLADEGGGSWRLVKVNVDDNPGLAQRYEVRGIPAVSAFSNGSVVASFVGAQPEPAVREFLAGLPLAEPPAKGRAESNGTGSGDGNGAGAKRESAVSEAETALRRRVSEAPEDLEARLELAEALASRAAHREALEGLLTIVEVDEGDLRMRAREKMIDVIREVGDNSPLAREYQSRLAALLW